MRLYSVLNLKRPYNKIHNGHLYGIRKYSWIRSPGLHNLEQSIIENSETAFRKAISAGVGIEIDVQMSGDRVPMVFHDETLSRLTGQDGRLSFMKSGVLKQIPYALGQDRILTLKDCLDLVDGQVPLLIEVKSHWTDRDEMEQGLWMRLVIIRGFMALCHLTP